MKKIITTKQAPAAIGPYSQAVSAGDFIFISGQIPLTPEGEPAEGGIAEQAFRVLENLKAILEAAGAGLEDVVRTTVFLDDLADFTVFNRIYGEYFPRRQPARACVGVGSLPRGVLIEISAIAFQERI